MRFGPRFFIVIDRAASTVLLRKHTFIALLVCLLPVGLVWMGQINVPMWQSRLECIPDPGLQVQRKHDPWKDATPTRRHHGWKLQSVTALHRQNRRRLGNRTNVWLKHWMQLAALQCKAIIRGDGKGFKENQKQSTLTEQGKGGGQKEIWARTSLLILTDCQTIWTWKKSRFAVDRLTTMSGHGNAVQLQFDPQCREAP